MGINTGFQDRGHHMKLTQQDLDLAWGHFREYQDDESRSSLAGHYFAYVYRIAKRVAKRIGYAISENELASYGVNGLYKSLDNFDETRGVKFETYAYQKIQGSMLDGMRSDDWVPRSVRIKHSTIEKGREKLEQKCGRRVTEDEILQVLDFDQKEYHKRDHHYNPKYVTSIDCASQLGIEAEDVSLLCNDKLVAHSSSSDAHVLRKEFLSKLIGKSFTKMEKHLIYLYYYENFTMKEISDTMDMSESRVSQIHQDIIRRLKIRVWVNPSYFDNDILSTLTGCKDKSSLFS